MATIWRTRDAVVKLSTAVTITSAAALDTFFSTGTAIEGKMKDITIKEPDGDVEQIYCLGEDTDSIQNAEMEEKPFTFAEVSGTLILSGDEVAETLLYPAGTAINGTHTRYQPAKGTRLRPSVLLNLDDSSDEVNIVLDDCWVTAKENKVTGADGHFEYSVTFKCLPKNFYVEFKD